MVLLLNAKYLMKPKTAINYAYIRNRNSKYNVCKRNSSIDLNMAKKGVRCTNITFLGSLLKSFPSNREASSWLASQLLAIMMARNFLSSTWFIFPVVLTTQLQRWRESSNKCTDSVNVRVHQAKWMAPVQSEVARPSAIIHLPSGHLLIPFYSTSFQLSTNSPGTFCTLRS